MFGWMLSGLWKATWGNPQVLEPLLCGCTTSKTLISLTGRTPTTPGKPSRSVLVCSLTRRTRLRMNGALRSWVASARPLPLQVCPLNALSHFDYCLFWEGGYTQGGGHSPLSSRYGLAADQVLEWEVVDASGQLLVATREKNKDLYWALSGGGGGTYGVVVSMTSKVHADVPVAAANITISASGLELDTFWTAVTAWHDILPSLLDQGIMATAYIMNDSFAVSPINAPGLSSKELASLLQPYFDQLDKSKITYKKFVGDFPGHLPEHEAMQPPQLVSLFQGAGWLIPRSVVEERNDALTAAFRSVMEDGGMILSLAINASREVAGDFDNSVLPAWRRAAVLAFIAT